MTIVEMLEQSGVLTLLGMGIVVSFLVILVICVTLMGKVIQALGGGKTAAGPAAPSGGTVKTTAVAAAITAAVSEYRANNE
jgi:oxaloacetate decarboxylase gamma subunit